MRENALVKLIMKLTVNVSNTMMFTNKKIRVILMENLHSLTYLFTDL